MLSQKQIWRKLCVFNCLLCVFSFICLSAPMFAQDGPFEKAFHQGTEAMRSQQLDEAVAYFSKAVALKPSFAEAYFNLGIAQLQQGHLAEAVTALSKSISLKPELRGANLFLGIARYRENDYAEAIRSLKHETRIDAANADAWMWLGVAQLAAGNATDASATLDKAALLSPDNVDILYHRGRAHMLVSKETYEHMYQVAPESWRIHQVLAQSLVEQTRYEEAANEAQVAIGLKPSEPGLHEELADIYWKQNDLVKAESEFQNELKVDPESLTSMYKLAVVSIERSKPEVSVKLLSEVLHKTSHSANAHYQMGRAEAQLENTEAAIQNFSSAVSDSGESDTETLRQSYYQLAQLYRREQKNDESRAALESFMRLKQQADAQQSQKLQDKLRRSAQMQDATQ
jgi:tetratricopeptide (TPR) repeat protein